MSNEQEHDPINHPSHYTGHPKGIECIDVIEDSPSLCLGNAIKYIWRANWGSKGSDLQDLQKAIWYLQREIERLRETPLDATIDEHLSTATIDISPESVSFALKVAPKSEPAEPLVPSSTVDEDLSWIRCSSRVGGRQCNRTFGHLEDHDFAPMRLLDQA